MTQNSKEMENMQNARESTDIKKNIREAIKKILMPKYLQSYQN